MDKSEVSDTKNSLRIEDEDRALDLQERASAEANARDFAERQWINASKRVPMRIMVAGLGGTGKSTLINRLFGLDVNENVAKEGCRGKATTEAVRCHKHKLKNDVEAIIFDTPGFDDPNINDHRILAEMKQKTEGKLDLLLYCVSMGSPGSRVKGGDVRAICLLTRKFGPLLWNNAIFVLTFANVACTWAKKDQYDQLIEAIDKELRKQLKDEARVPEGIVLKIPLATAGHTNTVNEPHEKNDWLRELFGKLLARNPETSMALLKGAVSSKEIFLEIVANGFVAVGLTAGPGTGAAVGAMIGAIVGALGGPFGAAGGAAVGSVVGAGTFGILGLIGGAGTLMWKDRVAVMEKEKEIKREEEEKKKQS